MNALREAIADLSGRPDTPQVRTALAEARFRLAVDPGTTPAEAIELLDAAAQADPFQPKVFLHLGRLLHRDGRYFAALREYRRAAELVPDSRRVQLLIAQAQLELGKAEQKQGRAVLTATNAWLLALKDQLSQPKPSRAQVTACLDLGAGADPAEYAQACLLVLVNGESPAKVRDLAAANRRDTPAGRMLDAVLELVEARDPATFVTTAVRHEKTLPIELVCWAHFTKFEGLNALDALQLLGSYPDDFRAQECFRELEIAVLDACARRAWAEERLHEAGLLWRETIPLDPHRVPVAINLALLAARTRSPQDYGPAWARLAELLYLHAAGAGDVQLMLDERTTLHRAISQNIRQRHVLGRETPDDEQILTWLADPEALEVWLREWDCYYLNARLGFRSPAYRLGAPTAAARDALVRHIDTELRPRGWSGINTFCDLAITSLQTHRQDDYRELEKPRADALLTEAFRHAMLLRRMLLALADDETGYRLPQGLVIARHLFALPWQAFGPQVVERGLLDPDVDLVGLFEVALIHLASRWRHPGHGKLAALDECIALLPHRLEPRAFRCWLLHHDGLLDEAYEETLAALRMPGTAAQRTDLVRLLGLIGRDAIPESLNDLHGRASLEAHVEAARVALARFPRSGALRIQLARVLTVLGGEDRTTEAKALLEEGIAKALTDGQRHDFEVGLTRTGEAAETDSARQRVLDLAKAAMDRAQEAVDEYNEARYAGMAHRSLAKMRQALEELAEALAIAEQAGLDREVAQLEKWLDHLGELEGELQHRGVW